MHKDQVILPTSEVQVFAKEYVIILMGKLSLAVRERIIKLNDMDQLYFQDVISYLCKKYKENSYKQLIGSRIYGGDENETRMYN